MGACRYPVLLLMFFALCSFCKNDEHDTFVNEKNKTSYKLMYVALPWDEARKSCENEGFNLAVPRTMEEFDFIQNVVRSMKYARIKGTNYKLLAWIGINNKDNHQIWKNIYGENIQEAQFHSWAEGNGLTFSADPKEPHCAGIDAHNRALRDYWCHRHQPYICERRSVTSLP